MDPKRFVAGKYGGKTVIAQSDRFVVGLCLVEDMNSPNRVKMKDWPVKGHRIEVRAYETDIPYGPGYPAMTGVSNQNPLGRIPFEDTVYRSEFDAPWTVFRQPGVEIKKGNTYKFTWDVQKDHRYDLTFWWIDDKEVRKDQGFGQSRASLDDSGRYIWLKNNKTSITVKALGR